MLGKVIAIVFCYLKQYCILRLPFFHDIVSNLKGNEALSYDFACKIWYLLIHKKRSKW